MLCQRNFEHFLDGLFQIHHKSLSLTVTYSELSFFPKNLDVSEAKKAQLQRSIGFLARCPTCSEQPLFVKGNSRTNQQLGCSKPVGPSLSWVLPLFHLSLTYTFDTPLLKMQDLATIGRTHGPYLWSLEGQAERQKMPRPAEKDWRAFRNVTNGIFATLPLYLIGSWFWITVSLPLPLLFSTSELAFSFPSCLIYWHFWRSFSCFHLKVFSNQGIPKGVSPNSSVKLLQTRASVFCWYQCFMRTLPLVGLWWWSASVWNIHNDHHLLSCFSCVSLQVHHLEGIGYQSIHQENGITTSIYPSLHRLHISRTSDSESRRSDASDVT